MISFKQTALLLLDALLILWTFLNFLYIFDIKVMTNVYDQKIEKNNVPL